MSAQPTMENCSQFCINTLGSYYCSCTTGYMLSANNQSCAGKKNFMQYLGAKSRNLIMLWSRCK